MLRADYTNRFNDSRLSRRGATLIQGLFSKATGVIQSIAQTRAEQKGYYRFLNSPKVGEDGLIEEMSQRCSLLAAGKTVLCIQDTTEINLCAHSGRLRPDSGLGSIDAVKKGIGFKLHPNLVVDAHSLMPYGFAGIRIWHRSEATKVPKSHKERVPIAAKESSKWLDGNQSAATYLQQASQVIVVQDREADIYEQFALPRADNQHLLIRSRCNRGLAEGDRLWDRLAEAPVAGLYRSTLEADSHKKTLAREAVFELRITAVILKCPDRKSWGVPRQSGPVYAISAKEITDGVEDPVDWKLMTTVEVLGFCDAVQMISWYRCRWMIEEVFRMLKKECYDIESSELERGWAIRKLSLMILDTIIKLFQMQLAYEQPEQKEGEQETEELIDLDADLVFKLGERQCLAEVGRRYEGKTGLLVNPHRATGLKAATWIIARLGGWKGYKSQRPFGMSTLLAGLKNFYQIYHGWAIAKDVGTR